MDNGTMVESFKFLNYFQLAKNSLASKRFRDLIRMHRHKLALLYVDTIDMLIDVGLNEEFEPGTEFTFVNRIFGKDLSPEEYNEWIVCNEYSKKIPLECQFAEMENTEDDRKVYELTCRYKVSPKLEHEDNASYATVFYANAELNHENWPLFEHFIRLLTNPFIYVKSMAFFALNEILYLLTKAMNPDRNRLQCERLVIFLEDNTPKFISWIKNHVHCAVFHISHYHDSKELNSDIELLDLFMTGANVCSSEVFFSMHDSYPKIIDDFVQKFLDLKERDEYQVVKSIAVSVPFGSTNELKEKYAEFIVKPELAKNGTPMYTFEFVNDNIRKKLELTTCMNKYGLDGYDLSCCVSIL